MVSRLIGHSGSDSKQLVVHGGILALETAGVAAAVAGVVLGPPVFVTGIGLVAAAEVCFAAIGR